MSKEHLIIFDTTLRDGEQSPGRFHDQGGKAADRPPARTHARGCHRGRLSGSVERRFRGSRAVAEAIKDSTVAGLCRAFDKDIARALEAVKPAKSGRIHTFIATSPIHMEKKLRMAPEDVLVAARQAVRFARNGIDDVEFSCEDAGRSDLDFLCRIIEAVIKEGASTINIPDTVGYNVPEQYAERIHQLRERIPNSDKVIWSVHCHNDLGLAVANSLAAVMAGARQVECTINGLGERAGNAALEEIVMAVHTRQDVFPCATRIDTTQIVAASKMVSSITGFPVQPNKAIVGANAFAHESGIHQDGVLKHRETYEIMRAEDVGWNANKLVLGKHSGRTAFKARSRSSASRSKANRC
jgi:2-isopropylmalate synthase